MLWSGLSSLLARNTAEFVFSILRTSPGIVWERIKLKVPPKIKSTPRRAIATIVGHQTCLQRATVVVFAILTLCFASRPIYRRFHVIETRGSSEHIGGAHRAKRAAENRRAWPPRAITTNAQWWSFGYLAVEGSTQSVKK